MKIQNTRGWYHSSHKNIIVLDRHLGNLCHRHAEIVFNEKIRRERAVAIAERLNVGGLCLSGLGSGGR